VCNVVIGVVLLLCVAVWRSAIYVGVQGMFTFGLACLMFGGDVFVTRYSVEVLFVVGGGVFGCGCVQCVWCCGVDLLRPAAGYIVVFSCDIGGVLRVFVLL